MPPGFIPIHSNLFLDFQGMTTDISESIPMYNSELSFPLEASLIFFLLHFLLFYYSFFLPTPPKFKKDKMASPLKASPLIHLHSRQPPLKLWLVYRVATSTFDSWMHCWVSLSLSLIFFIKISVAKRSP